MADRVAGGSLVIVTMCVVGAVRVFNRKRRRGWGDARAFLLAWLAFFGLFLGGWIGYPPVSGVSVTPEEDEAAS